MLALILGESVAVYAGDSGSRRIGRRSASVHRSSANSANIPRIRWPRTSGGRTCKERGDMDELLNPADEPDADSGPA